MLKKIKRGDYVTLRNGLELQVFDVDASNPQQLHLLLARQGYQYYHVSGRFFTHKESDKDIIEVESTTKGVPR